jgi:hypothetical protein
LTAISEIAKGKGLGAYQAATHLSRPARVMDDAVEAFPDQNLQVILDNLNKHHKETPEDGHFT